MSQLAFIVITVSYSNFLEDGLYFESKVKYAYYVPD